MKSGLYHRVLSIGLFLLIITSMTVSAKQFTVQWLDIGTFQSNYSESGSRSGAVGNSAQQPSRWPAILRNSGHIYSKAFWLGTKDWTDANGQKFPYFVARIGPGRFGQDMTFPIQNKLISRTEDTVVEVDGSVSFNNVAIVDEINPSLSSDRMIHNIHNTYIVPDNKL